MDKFEERMVRMDALCLEEFEKLLAESRNKCICPECSTYSDCAKWGAESLYCLVGRSRECAVSEVSCVCNDCPLAKELGMRFTHFFCTLGSEKERRGEEERV
jgi:hypothetical protein